MRDSDYFPQIRPIFSLTKKDVEDFDRDAVTHRLSIVPTETSGPKLSKGTVNCGPNIQEISKEFIGLSILPAPAPPYQMIKHAHWSIELPKIKCWDLEEPLQKVEQILYGTGTEVRSVCDEYNLRADLILRVFAESNNMAELTIPSSSVSFWASMGASIGFDFYLD